MADIKYFYNNLIIINLYNKYLCLMVNIFWKSQRKEKLDPNYVIINEIELHIPNTKKETKF